jgi:beta-lactamase regulating signal transducer with metallopeptidase domain
MITYIIKSTISLMVLYGFFHFFLRQYKILVFNRIYLISSLVFSLIIPLITIPVNSGFIINTGIRNLNLTTVQIIQSGGNTVRSTPHISFLSIAFILFLAISGILLVRFAFNIFNLFRKIKKSKKIENQYTTIVLVEENIIPYSFFRYIFVNRQSFEEGKIERELILHEEAHCMQYHSIDIILLELINVFFWFNPAIWLFRKAIQLNHEYYADNRVLTNSDSEDYHQLLINLVIQNNTSFLVSNFKYSLIKNRLIMMTKISPSNYAILRKIAGVTLFLFLGMAITFSKEKILNINIPDFKIEVLAPIPGNEKPELWPVKPGEGASAFHSTSRTFGQKYINPVTKNQTVHYGIDIQAKFGTDVVATSGGKVIKAIYDGGLGNTIVIDHGEGYQSMYAHLKDFAVKNGDTVTKGQTIGHVGSTGLSTGAHLHFEVSLEGEKLNPLNYLR